jgi:acyl-CoA reductase-like NAD-dependent aldehyde dehydrogenase
MQAHEERAVTSTTSSCAALVSDRVRQLRTLAHHPNEESDRVVAALCAAAARLLNDRSSLASALRRDLVESTRLSPAMVEWGLTTTLNTVQPALLRELALATHGTMHCQPVAHRLVAVVLAGNLFSAAVRALFLPLLAGANVIAKAAHHDAALPSALKRALDEVDHEIGQRLEIVQFARQDGAATTALLSHADAVSAYGDDSTLRALSGQLRSSARLIAHGHGVSAVYIAREQLASPHSARDVADRVALDVAAYDQRGCLSPHAVFVEAGAAVDARSFARLLAHESLPLLSELLPLGKLSTAEQAAGLQWQAVAATRGELFASPGHAVSFEHNLSPRPSPGGRLVAVHSCSSLDALPDALSTLGPHLKCLGVAGSRSERQRIAARLSAISTARVCRIGEMQTPPFDAYADGLPPLDGLLDFVDMR